MLTSSNISDANKNGINKLGFFASQKSKKQYNTDLLLARIYYRTGVSLRYRKRPQQPKQIKRMIYFFKKAVSLNSHAFAAWESLADCYMYLRDYVHALNSYEKVLEQLPRSLSKIQPSIYCRIAKCKAKLGKITEAINLLKEISSYDPLYAEAYFLLGLCYKAKKDSGKAFVAFSKAIYLARDEKRFKKYQKKLSFIQKKVEATITSVTKHPVALARTRSNAMYWSLSTKANFSPGLAEAIIKRKLIIIDHEIDFVMALQNRRKLISVGIAREAIILDFCSSSFSDAMQTLLDVRTLFTSLLAVSGGVARKLELITGRVHNVIPYHEYSGDKTVLMLYDFNTTTGGSCRHLALHAAYLTALAINRNLLPLGSVNIWRNAVGNLAHAWCTYATSDYMHLYLIDTTLNSGKRIYDLKDRNDLCEIIFIYAKSRLPGLLNDLLISNQIEIPSAQQIQQRIDELKADEKKEDDTPTQPYSFHG